MRRARSMCQTTESATPRAEVADNSIPPYNVGDENDHLCGFRKCYVCVRISRATMKFSFSDRVEVPKHVLVRFVQKETVLLNLETECYYGLDETGTRMWQVVIAAPSVERANEELLSEFDVEPELLRQHISDLLGKLTDLGLLRVLYADVQLDPAI